MSFLLALFSTGAHPRRRSSLPAPLPSVRPPRRRTFPLSLPADQRLFPLSISALQRLSPSAISASAPPSLALPTGALRCERGSLLVGILSPLNAFPLATSPAGPCRHWCPFPLVYLPACIPPRWCPFPLARLPNGSPPLLRPSAPPRRAPALLYCGLYLLVPPPAFCSRHTRYNFGNLALAARVR